jgi:hypothetical protein
VPTIFADRGCHVVSVTNPYGHILSFLDRSPLLFLPSSSSVDVRHEASRYFRNKKREYLKDKINELAMNSKNKNIRDLNRGIN